MCDKMRTQFGVLLIYQCVTILECMFVYKHAPAQLSPKSSIETEPKEVTCKLGDIVFIKDANFRKDTKSSEFKLFRPNGDIIPINFNNKDIRNITYYEDLSNEIEIEALDLKKDDYNDVDENIKIKNIVIGPVLEEDHGNWVLSHYYKDKDGEWTEEFRVITINILDPVPAYEEFVTLNPGDTFRPRFAYPIKGLELCILVSHDNHGKKYDRDKKRMDFCAFIVDDISVNDKGKWYIYALGKIAYKATIHLTVKESSEEI